MGRARNDNDGVGDRGETRRPDGTRERCEIGAIRRNLLAPAPDHLGLRLAPAQHPSARSQIAARSLEQAVPTSSRLVCILGPCDEVGVISVENRVGEGEEARGRDERVEGPD